MTKLTTERLEYYAALPTEPSERKAIFMYEVRCMARHLLAYEQAPAQPVMPGRPELRYGDNVHELAGFDAKPNYDIHRDANRYRFLRDKDAFGDDCAPGLSSWDDLAELDAGEFDSAVDARILSFEMPQHILNKTQERAATAGVYAELYRLREEVKGPDGFDTWKDAAIAERKARVELEKSVQVLSDIDYLNAMSAFHSDEWHKMGPITGYMHGWNAYRADMLKNGKSASTELPNHSNLSTNSPVIPDGWKLVPIEPTPKMLVAAMGMFTAEELAEAWGDMIEAAPAPAQESE